MDEEDFYEKAEKRVNAKKGFFIHLGTFLPVGIFLFALNMITSPDTLWFLYPILSWGVGLAIHYVTVFGIPGTRILTDEWEEEELDNEIRKLRRMHGKKMLKKNLLKSGRDEDGLDLRELDKQAEELFDEEDLV